MNNMNPTKKPGGGGTQVVANDKQSISLIRHLQCYLYNQYVLDTTLHSKQRKRLTGATSGAGTDNSSWTPKFIPDF